jgi:hypothetical protein
VTVVESRVSRTCQVLLQYSNRRLYFCSKSRRGSSGIYEKDEKLNDKEKELMEKEAEVFNLPCNQFSNAAVYLNYSMT